MPHLAFLAQTRLRLLEALAQSFVVGPLPIRRRRLPVLGLTAPVLLVPVALAAPCCVSDLPRGPAYDAMSRLGSIELHAAPCSTCDSAIGRSRNDARARAYQSHPLTRLFARSVHRRVAWSEGRPCRRAGAFSRFHFQRCRPTQYVSSAFHANRS